MSIKGKYKNIKKSFAQKLFDIVSKPASKMTQEKLLDYSKVDDVVEMVQEVINRYDEAIESIVESTKQKHASINSRIDINQKTIDSISSLARQTNIASKVIQELISNLQESIKADNLDVKWSNTTTSYSEIYFDGDYKICSIEERLHPSLVHKYLRIYLDGCLLMYSGDYSLELSEKRVKVVFEEPVPAGSSILYELVKNI